MLLDLKESIPISSPDAEVSVTAYRNASRPETGAARPVTAREKGDQFCGNAPPPPGFTVSRRLVKSPNDAAVEPVWCSHPRCSTGVPAGRQETRSFLSECRSL